MTKLPEKEYYASIPRKRMGSGVLLFNKEGELLILKMSYRDGWTIPGGVVDEGESPLQACVRETLEEVGLKLVEDDLYLLSVSHSSTPKFAPWRGDSMQFTFGRKVLTTMEQDNIQIDNDEIIDYKFVNKDTICKYFNKNLCDRITETYKTLDSKTAFYFDYNRVNR